MGLASFGQQTSNSFSSPLGQSGGLDQFGKSATGLLDPYVGNGFTQLSQFGGVGNSFTDRAQTGGGLGNSFTDLPDTTSGATAQAGQTATGGMASAVGGDWAALDAHNNEINAAAQQYGVPANLLKAMVNRESSGDWEKNNYINSGYRGDDMLPFVGIFRQTANAWGLDFDSMVGNKQAQIGGMAKILNGLSQQYGGYENAAKVYFGGEQALQNGGFTDELGMNSNTYGAQAVKDWHFLDSQGGGTGGGGNYAGNPTGNSITTIAQQYVGVPYVWGSLPQAGDDPWKTGWDCSAFVDFLDNKYGGNQLPAGSHYQFQDTVNKGLLVTDPNALQPGDLVFFDTGNTAGGGHELNNAGHVGMYIGNGKFIQAANPSAGTIVSNLSDYIGMYGFLGGRSMSWGAYGGSNPVAGATGGGGSFSNRIQQYLYQ